MAWADLLGERQWVDQYSIETVGIVIHVEGVPSNPDTDVLVSMKTLEDEDIFLNRVATNPAIGVFETQLQSPDTQNEGLFKLNWEYEVATKPQIFVNVIEIGPASPAYVALNDDFKYVIETTWIRFADLFDSPYGGPHLQVYFQSHFTRGRMAQLLGIAVGTLNTIAQPFSTYTLESDGGFPVQQWGALLEKMLYMESLKHLIRSYTEQPEAVNVSIARQDRRDYMQRWMQVLDLERQEAARQLESFKIAHMGLGSPRVLVAGGVYGQYGPHRIAGSAAARPRYYYRFH